MAVLAAAIAAALLSGLALAIALLGAGEGMLASHERMSRSLRQAAEGAVQLALADLRSAPSWDVVLAAGGVAEVSAAPGRLFDGSLLPPAPWGGGVVDLRAATVRLQAAADAGRGPGDGPQVWRLFIAGPLARAVPGVAAPPWYVGVWVADDRADSDGDGGHDSNGIVAVRGMAFGPFDALAAVDASLWRDPAGSSGAVRILTIRPGS
jgi:hypothetical protein